MTIRWMKLDLDFWHDRKFVALLSEKGEQGGFKVVKLYCLATECYGRLDMADASIRRWVEGEVGLKGKRLDDFIEVCVDCEIFDREAWAIFKVITCDRLIESGEKRRETEEKRRAAGKASGEARRNASQ